MIASIWPNLPKVNYNVNPPAMSEEQRRLAMWLSQSGNMAPLSSGSATKKTIWWVSKQWIEVTGDFIQRRVGKPNWWEEKVSLVEAGETRRPQPVTITHVQPTAPATTPATAPATVTAPRPASPVAHTAPATQQPIDPGITIFRCKYCAYESTSNRSLGTHNGRLGDKRHPTGRFPCPVTTCREVRPDVDALGSHLSKDHRDLGLEICRTCGHVSKNRTDRIDHQMRMHEGAYVRQPTMGGALAFAQELDGAETWPQAPASGMVHVPAASAPALTAPSNSPAPVTSFEMNGINGIDALSNLQKILLDAEVARARAAAIPGLEARLAELEEENTDLRERDHKIAEWLRSYPFLNDSNK
jgi:hypothetical protein